MANENPNEQGNREPLSLSKGFKSLTADHQKLVLKTALGLLRLQRAWKTVAADKTLCLSLKSKNG